MDDEVSAYLPESYHKCIDNQAEKICKSISKEVKKMSRPYFETKVVKIEKKRKLDMNPRRAGKATKYWSSFSDEVLERLQVNTKRELERRKIEKAYKEGKWFGDNWVNGENLDKIKFPCFCRWNGGFGMIVHGYGAEREYILVKIEEQVDNGEVCTVNRCDTLKHLIELHDIHILKGKIIIYEEK